MHKLNKQELGASQSEGLQNNEEKIPPMRQAQHSHVKLGRCKWLIPSYLIGMVEDTHTRTQEHLQQLKRNLEVALLLAFSSAACVCGFAKHFCIYKYTFQCYPHISIHML